MVVVKSKKNCRGQEQELVRLGDNGMTALGPASSNLAFALVRSEVTVTVSQLSVTGEMAHYAIYSF